eukprot:g21830.t1
MSLSKEVDTLKKEAATFTERLTQFEEARSKEQESYRASTRDRGLTIKVVQKAKSIVEGFYKSNDPTSLFEQKAEPKETWRLGRSRNGGLGSSVIAMLDTIVSDFKKEQADADQAEQASAEELDKVRSDTNQVKADAELKTASLSATEDALSKLGSDCTSLLATYEKLTDERRKQILQLQDDVADILSGATVGSRTGLNAGLLELQSLDAEDD